MEPTNLPFRAKCEVVSQFTRLASMDSSAEVSELYPSPISILNGGLDSPNSTADSSSTTTEGLRGPGPPPNTPNTPIAENRRLQDLGLWSPSPNSTADTASLPEPCPTSSAENGLGSHSTTESLPSISTPRSPILDRAGRKLAMLNEHCRQALLRTSSESSMSSTVEELPFIPPRFIGGCVMDNSKHKYIVSDIDEVESEDIEQPNTSQTSMMVAELCAFIRPLLKQNVDLYSELYKRSIFRCLQAYIKKLDHTCQGSINSKI